MISGESIIIKGCGLIIGEKYDIVFNRLKNEILTFSDLDKDGNAFITVGNVDLFAIKGEATLFFHMGALDNIVLSSDWSKYNLIKQNGERMHIEEAAYLIYKKCHNFLMENYGATANDDYIPEIFKISKYHYAALYLSPGRDSVSLVLRSEM